MHFKETLECENKRVTWKSISVNRCCMGKGMPEWNQQVLPANGSSRWVQVAHYAHLWSPLQLLL